MLANKSTLTSYPHANEAGITDNNALQTLKFIYIDGSLAGFANGTAPSLDAVLRRTLALNGIARTRVLEEQKCSRAGKNIFGYVGHHGARFFSKILSRERLKRLRPKNKWAEIWRARHIVFDPIPGFVALLATELEIGINGEHVSTIGRVRQVEDFASQPFIEKPDPTCVNTRWCFSNPCLQRLGARGEEKPLKNRKIQPFVFQSKGQVTFQTDLRCMARRQNSPSILIKDSMALARRKKLSWQRHGKAVGINQRSVASRRGSLRKPLLLKNRHRV